MWQLPYGVSERQSSLQLLSLHGENSAAERASVSPDDRKFNVIMYGIEECKKGIPRHVRMSNNTKSASETIQEVCLILSAKQSRLCEVG